MDTLLKVRVVESEIALALKEVRSYVTRDNEKINSNNSTTFNSIQQIQQHLGLNIKKISNTKYHFFSGVSCHIFGTNAIDYL